MKDSYGSVRIRPDRKQSLDLRKLARALIELALTQSKTSSVPRPSNSADDQSTRRAA